MSGLCAHNSPSSSFVNCNGLASYESNRAKLAASKPASATKHLFDPFPVLLAPLESWIFLLLWMVSFINHKGHEVTRRGTLLRFRSYSVGPSWLNSDATLSVACSAMPQTSYNFRSFRAGFEPVRNLLS